MKHVLSRILLAVAAAGLALVLVEGVLSLSGGRSLRLLVYGDLPQFQTLRSMGDEGHGGGTAGGGAPAEIGDGGRADAPLPDSVFDFHPDPRVGRALRRSTTVGLSDIVIATDEIGMRKRPAPPRGPDPLRIAVVGDSVAFGLGLTDEQCLAAVLERLLAEHRAPDSRPVEVRTVAVPGWNARNSSSFLLDHWDVLRPDVVLFVPVGNDLSDSITAIWSGFGQVTLPDLNAPDPWFHVGYNAAFLETLLERRQHGEVRTSLREAGTVAVESDLGPESSRRFDDMAAMLLELQDRLASLGSKLCLLPYTEDDYWWIVQDHLLRAGARIPVIPMLARLLAEDQLPANAHPNARSNAVFAAWAAAALIQSGDVPGPLTSPLPEAPADVAARRARLLDEAGVRRRADEARARAREALLPEVNLDTGVGCLQVYGALDGAGRVQSRLLVLLRAPGPRLRLEVSAVAERPDLYPLPVVVEVNGQRVGEIVIERPLPRDLKGGAAPRLTATFELPDLGGAPACDVKLIPARYAVAPDRRKWGEVSFRLHSIACVER
jgi:hypothetical protein